MSLKTLKILYIITSLRTGGAEKLVADLSLAMKKKGHDVTILVFDGTSTFHTEELKRKGIKIIACGEGRWHMWNPWHLFKIKKILGQGHYDIVHAHNTPAQLLTAFSKGKKHNSPVFMTTEHNSYNRRRNWKWAVNIDKWMYDKYEKIICVNDSTKANLLDRLKTSDDNKKFVTIYNGIDLNKYNDFKNQKKEVRSSEKKEIIILMVAAFRKQKNHSVLIRALQYLPENYKVWFAGEGTEKKACEKLAQDLNLNSRIQFLGNQKDIKALQEKADVMVLSSHYEGLSLASIEGMISGKPFLASDVDGLREIVEGAGFLFTPGDEKELAMLVKKLMDDSELYRQVVVKCRDRAKKFDLQKTINQHEMLYMDSLNA